MLQKEDSWRRAAKLLKVKPDTLKDVLADARPAPSPPAPSPSARSSPHHTWRPPLPARPPPLNSHLEHVLTDTILDRCESFLQTLAPDPRKPLVVKLGMRKPPHPDRSHRPDHPRLKSQRTSLTDEQRQLQQKKDRLVLRLRLKDDDLEMDPPAAAVPAKSKKAPPPDSSASRKRRSRKRLDDEEDQQHGVRDDDDDDALHIQKKQRRADDVERKPRVKEKLAKKPRSHQVVKKPRGKDASVKSRHAHDEEPQPAHRRRTVKILSDAEATDANSEDSKTPLEHILEFARSVTTALSKGDKLDKKQYVKKRLSLATFRGCDEFINVSLVSYLQAHASFQLRKVDELRKEGPKSEALRDGLNGLTFEMDEEELMNAVGAQAGRASTRKRHKVPCPPIIAKVADVLQLAVRVWQKMASSGTDASIQKGFFSAWYASSTRHAVANLAVSILLLYRDIRAEISDKLKERTDEASLVEWSIRALATLILFELSPVSPIDDLSTWEMSSLFLTELAKGEPIKLSDIIDFAMDHIGSESSSTARDFKQIVGELVQVYITRYHCRWQTDSQRKSLSKALLDEQGKHLETVVQHKQFWSTVVHLAIQIVRKELSEAPEGCLGIAFLVCLLSRPSSSRSLLQKQIKQREDLLHFLLQCLRRVGRRLMGSLAEVEENESAYPGLPSIFDLIRKLMSLAVVQRELVSSGGLNLRTEYLESIQQIITAASKLVKGTLNADVAARYAQEGNFGRQKKELLVEAGDNEAERSKVEDSILSSEQDDEEAKRVPAIVRYKAVAFGAWLMGSLGKSMEDGSRDMSQMNGLEVLINAHFNSNRMLKRLWTTALTIQIGVDRNIPTDLQLNSSDKNRDLLSDAERNNFSMVLEAIRLRVISSDNDRGSRDELEDGVKERSFSAERAALHINRKKKVVFPDVTKIIDLRKAVCLKKGHADMDDDRIIMKRLEETLRSQANEVLARYDDESSLVTSWIRLSKRNSYVGDARNLLEKADKMLGNPCGCIPGNHGVDQNNGRNQIACSNDSCENRSSKVECVPGECGSGAYCQNQRMQKLEYAKTKMIAFDGKGVGVVADEDIPAGTLIGEYQGEVISMKMFEERKKEYRGERHFYFMTLTSKLVIDASRKSQHTRFVNHSCEPNAETQKWNAGGEPRVGIFAMKDIPKGAEVTFDYGARSLANDSVPCLCGAKGCKGFLTVAKKSEEVLPEKEELAISKHMITDDTRSHSDHEGEQKQNEEMKKVEADVEEKIKKAKDNIKIAEGLRAQRKDMSEPVLKLSPSSITEDMKQRLDKWEKEVKVMIKENAKSTVISISEDEAPKSPVPIVRIPRRLKEKPAQPIQEKSSHVAKPSNVVASKPRHSAMDKPGNSAMSKHGLGKVSRPAQNMKDLSTHSRRDKSGHSSLAQESILKAFTSRFEARKTSPKKPVPPKRPLSKPVPPSSIYEKLARTSNLPSAHRQNRLTSNQNTFGGVRDGLTHSEAQRRSSLPSEGNKLRNQEGPNKAPRAGFLPTSSRVKKPRLAPKFVSRPRPKKDGSDDDSMDEYSTASSAEPVMDEPPILSPSRLPDGSGACSDDEFVAAPPVSEVLRQEEELESRLPDPFSIPAYPDRPHEKPGAGMREGEPELMNPNDALGIRDRGGDLGKPDSRFHDQYRREGRDRFDASGRHGLEGRERVLGRGSPRHDMHRRRRYSDDPPERYSGAPNRARSPPEHMGLARDPMRHASNTIPHHGSNDRFGGRHIGQDWRDRQDQRRTQSFIGKYTREAEEDAHRHHMEMDSGRYRERSPHDSQRMHPARGPEPLRSGRSRSPPSMATRLDMPNNNGPPVRERRDSRGLSPTDDRDWLLGRRRSPNRRSRVDTDRILQHNRPDQEFKYTRLADVPAPYRPFDDDHRTRRPPLPRLPETNRRDERNSQEYRGRQRDTSRDRDIDARQFYRSDRGDFHGSDRRDVMLPHEPREKGSRPLRFPRRDNTDARSPTQNERVDAVRRNSFPMEASKEQNPERRANGPAADRFPKQFTDENTGDARKVSNHGNQGPRRLSDPSGDVMKAGVISPKRPTQVRIDERAADSALRDERKEKDKVTLTSRDGQFKDGGSKDIGHKTGQPVKVPKHDSAKVADGAKTANTTPQESVDPIRERTKIELKSEVVPLGRSGDIESTVGEGKGLKKIEVPAGATMDRKPTAKGDMNQKEGIKNRSDAAKGSDSKAADNNSGKTLLKANGSEGKKKVDEGLVTSNKAQKVSSIVDRMGKKRVSPSRDKGREKDQSVLERIGIRSKEVERRLQNGGGSGKGSEGGRGGGKSLDDRKSGGSNGKGSKRKVSNSDLRQMLKRRKPS